MNNFRKIFKEVNRHSWVFVILGYLVISLIFNYNLFWKEIFFDRSKIGAVYGEVQGYEWGNEKFYQALISGHNPFASTKAMLYPLEVNVGLFDSGYGLFFPLLRTFLSTHQAVSILIALSLIIANIGMYLLLRRLNFSKLLSFIIGAAFGYTTFLMPRAGHLTYWSHFVFPWFYYCCISLLTNKNNIKKVLFSFGVSVFFVLTLFLNMYYFIILLISIFSLVGYFLLFNNKIFFRHTKNNWKYFIFTGLLIFVFMVPWLKGLYELMMFDQVPKTAGWGGAIQFSSDLFNYFLPSQYSYLFTKFPFLLKPLNMFLRLYRADARAIFENYTYPGIIIIFSYFVSLFIFRKKGFQVYKERLQPYLIASLVILILTLGPFLHIFGHWRIPVDDDIRIVIPLPYIFLHYIPFLQNVRVPGRLIVGFIFFAYIVSAYIMNYLLIKKPTKIKVLVFTLLFIVFFADHKYYAVEPPIVPRLKNAEKIFNTIKKDKEFSTVLEVPFTVRDGFTYFGNGNAIQMIIGEGIHGKPFLGGYIGRIPDYKKAYYQSNPFLGYLGRQIDDDVKNNPIIDKADLVNWQQIDIKNSKKTIDFLDIKYLINNDTIPQTASLSAIYQNLGFEKKLIENQSSLWIRKLDKNEHKNIEINDPSSKLFLGFGWYDRENDFRWMDRRSMVMFKIEKKRKMDLNFKAESFNKDIKLSIYLNKDKVGDVEMSRVIKDYQIPVNKDFEKGINYVYFISDKAYIPAKIIPGSLDQRKLSAKFTKIYITEKR